METAPNFTEQYRLYLYKDGKFRNRAEAHLVRYAQELLAKPVPYTIEAVRLDLLLELEKVNKEHPSWGTCSLSGLQVSARMMHNHSHVSRSFGIVGRGRALSTLDIVETVMKDASNGYAPIIKARLG